MFDYTKAMAKEHEHRVAKNPEVAKKEKEKRKRKSGDSPGTAAKKDDAKRRKQQGLSAVPKGGSKRHGKKSKK